MLAQLLPVMWEREMPGASQLAEAATGASVDQQREPGREWCARVSRLAQEGVCARGLWWWGWADCLGDAEEGAVGRRTVLPAPRVASTETAT